jgi:hypothetical protein
MHASAFQAHPVVDNADADRPFDGPELIAAAPADGLPQTGFAQCDAILT